MGRACGERAERQDTAAMEYELAVRVKVDKSSDKLSEG